MIKATNSHETADANAMSADRDTLCVRTYLRMTGEQMTEDVTARNIRTVRDLIRLAESRGVSPAILTAEYGERVLRHAP